MSPSAPIVPRIIRRIIAVAGIVVLGLEWANTGLFAQFSAGVQLIEVYATVTDANGELVMGLRQSDFQVVENDRPQEISAFAAGEFPLTVALGVDRSFSMAGEPLRLAKLASQTFLKQLKPGDRSMIVAIGNNAEVIAPLSTDRAAQSQAIAALDAWSTTSLNDAVIVALDRLEPEKGRQALIVFSDGADRYSEATSGQVLARARRSQALVYPITMGKTRVPASVELATLTGGRSFLLRDAKELERTLSTIARELRYQYLIGYVPSAPPKPGVHEWRAIRVMLKNPTNGLRVRARDGYTAE
ncbi:MAG TPA: VWA domain-containing protein [Vicinamibacterales bacterium]|nr:VWA domain-containing protein [Vicinamibacterales bacterium]